MCLGVRERVNKKTCVTARTCDDPTTDVASAVGDGSINDITHKFFCAVFGFGRFHALAFRVCTVRACSVVDVVGRCTCLVLGTTCDVVTYSTFCSLCTRDVFFSEPRARPAASVWFVWGYVSCAWALFGVRCYIMLTKVIKQKS